MNNKLSCNQLTQPRATELRKSVTWLVLILAAFAIELPVTAGDVSAPGWLHALANVALPAHDEKTDAVQLFSEQIVTVQSADKVRTLVREAYKILRPGGREHGYIVVGIDLHTKVISMRGWCIPAQGKDYEVKDKEAMEFSLLHVEGSELISDVRDKVLQIPASDPGNLIGYEYEVEVQPYILQDFWHFQETAPAREARYTLQLPPGWEYKATWLNYPAGQPASSGNNQWQWVVSDVKGIRHEDHMPPWRGIAGQMIVSFFPPGGAAANKGFASWSEMGTWYSGLAAGRRDASPEIKQSVAALTASAPTTLDKMRAVARFVQQNIRYVAIELGIGGFQPHPAMDVFTHRYGDCKDKATLMSAMLHQFGVESYYVIINSRRGTVTGSTPAIANGFNHAILAIRLPDGLEDSSLTAVIKHPTLGRILFFDPTDELTPIGSLHGDLQSNFGLVVTPDGGSLVELPMLPPELNGIRRTGKMILEANGTLKGDIKEVRFGDRARAQRWELRAAAKDADRIKPIESILTGSFALFHITAASFANFDRTDLPFLYNYSLVAENYAKLAGNLLLVRPRIVGRKSSDLLETKEPRKYAVEFEGPSRDTDVFEIALPAGFELDDLPPPVSADYSFASYHSKTEADGRMLRYTRTFEVKELSVPLAKVEELKKLYRIIASDERNTAVLKPTSH